MDNHEREEERQSESANKRKQIRRARAHWTRECTAKANRTEARIFKYDDPKNITNLIKYQVYLPLMVNLNVHQYNRLVAGFQDQFKK